MGHEPGLLVTAGAETARRYFYILFGCKTCFYLFSAFGLCFAMCFEREPGDRAEPTASSLFLPFSFSLSQKYCGILVNFFSLALFFFCAAADVEKLVLHTCPNELLIRFMLQKKFIYAWNKVVQIKSNLV